MKNLSLICCFFFQFAYSQTNTWFKEGEEWTYIYPTIPNYNRPPSEAKKHYIKIRPIGDTLIKGKNCRILDIKYCPPDSSISHEYVYENLDTIFYYNYHTDQFYALFNFKAQEGDTIWVHKTPVQATKGFIAGAGTFAYKIISVTSVNLGGKTVNSQVVSSVDYGNGSSVDISYYNTTITQFEGPGIYLFGFSTSYIPEIDFPYLVTYLVNSQVVDGTKITCKEVTALKEDLKVEHSIVISQSNDLVFIKAKEEIKEIVLIDIFGTIVTENYNYFESNNRCEFNRPFKSGIYILRVAFKDKIYVKKIFFI